MDDITRELPQIEEYEREEPWDDYQGLRGEPELTGEELSGYEYYEEQPRPKKKKKRKKKRYFLRFCIFCAVCFALFKFLSSSYFAVSKFVVTGNEYYTPAQIVEMSGLRSGVNIFFETKLRPARDALLADPYIKVAEIKRSPRDTIKINLTERLEYAAVPYEQQYILIDEEGVVLRISDTEPVLPILGNMAVSDMTPGKPLQVEQTYLLTDTLELLAMVEENDIYFKRIDFSTVIIRAYIYDDLYCEGTPSNIKDNMGSLQKLLQELYQQDIVRGVIRVGTDSYLSYSPTY